MGQGERPIEDFHAIRDAGGIFYVSHSGGKDSQAMYVMLIDLIPADQIVVVHADLGEVLVRGLGTTLIDGKHKGNPDYWTLAKVLKATPEGIAQNVELITEWRYYDGSGYFSTEQETTYADNTIKELAHKIERARRVSGMAENPTAIIL